MEDSDNIVLMHKECVDKKFPDKGKLDVEIGEYAKLKFESEFGNEYMWVHVTKVDKEKGI